MNDVFEDKKPWVLVDGSSFLYRAYHALPALTSPQGHPTGAMVGVLNMVKKLTEAVDTPHWVMVFDTPGLTHRHELYPDYKAHRGETPQDLIDQIAPLKHMLKAMGFPLMEVSGVEADDVLATLVRLARDQDQPVYLITGDKDLTQLVDESVIWWNTMHDQRLDPQGVLDKFGVRPDQIADWLALVGDTSDNIPGVPGVGPKTATKWITAHENLDALMQAADTIKGKVGDNLRAHLEQLRLSRSLVTLDDHVALPAGWSTSKGPPDNTALRDAYRHWGLVRWLKELDAQEATQTDLWAPEPTQHEYTCIDTPAIWETWRRRLEQADHVAFDLETTSLNPREAKLVGVAFALGTGDAAYLPMGHQMDAQACTLEALLDFFKHWLNRPELTLIGHHLKYDLSILAQYGIMPHALKLFDTLLAHYVLDSTTNRRDLKTLSEVLLGIRPTHYEDVVGSKDPITFDLVPIDQATAYAAQDADLAWQLYEHFSDKLAQTPSLERLFHEMECPLIHVLVAMETQGVMIHAASLHQHSSELATHISKLEERAHTEAGQSFNLSSPKQLRTILFESMGIPPVSKTPSGVPSTSEDVLEQLSTTYTLPSIILEHRHASKLKSTYTDKLPLEIHPKTGRVHCSYNQAVTATGRLSSNQPNLQNIPIRREDGRRIRKAFIAPPDHVLLAADYSQIELRIMAHLCEDAKLLAAFDQGLDIHTATASELFDIPLDDVSTDQRRHAKTINFGLLYGMSAFGLAKSLGIERYRAQAYMDQYFDRYHGVRMYMDTIREQARAQGYVETIMGRRLYLPDIKASRYPLRAAAERAAINAPMQGSAADLIKIAMIQVHDWLHQAPLVTTMTMQVHDELVFEVPERELETVVPKIQSIMTGAMTLKVPLEVSLHWASNWDEAH